MAVHFPTPILSAFQILPSVHMSTLTYQSAELVPMTPRSDVRGPLERRSHADEHPTETEAGIRIDSVSQQGVCRSSVLLVLSTLIYVIQPRCDP